MTKTIQFKSNPIMWDKEQIGLKTNTIRFKDTDIRFKILDDWIKKPFELRVEIINTRTGEMFIRHVTDVSVHERFYYIISW
jgi:hypothetical protein